MEIRSVVKSCSIRIVQLGKYRLGSGEATKLTIHVDVINSYTHRVATCVLKTDHPTFRDWAYRVAFVSVPFVVAAPDVLNLGSFAVDGRNLDTVKRATLDLFADAKVNLAPPNFTVPDELELDDLSSPEVRSFNATCGTLNTRFRFD